LDLKRPNSIKYVHKIRIRQNLTIECGLFCVEECVYFQFTLPCTQYIILLSFCSFNTKSRLLTFLEIPDKKGKQSARRNPSRRYVKRRIYSLHLFVFHFSFASSFLIFVMINWSNYYNMYCKLYIDTLGSAHLLFFYIEYGLCNSNFWNSNEFVRAYGQVIK